MTIDFKEKWNNLSKKTIRKEFEKINGKFPDHIPIIVFTDNNIKLDKHKYLVKDDMTVGQFMYVLRKRIDLNEHEATFLFVRNKIVTPTDMLNILYKQYKEDCGFLFLYLNKESTFGC